MQSVTIHMSCARAGVSVSRYLPSAASPGVARCRSHLEVFVRGERDERAERNDVRVAEVAQQPDLAQHLLGLVRVVEDLRDLLDRHILLRDRVERAHDDRVRALPEQLDVGVPTAPFGACPAPEAIELLADHRCRAPARVCGSGPRCARETRS